MADIPIECNRCGFRGAVSSYTDHKNRTCFKCGDELSFIVPEEQLNRKALTLKPRLAHEAALKELGPAQDQSVHDAHLERSLWGRLFKRP